MFSSRGFANAFALSTACSALRFSGHTQLKSTSTVHDEDDTMPFCVFGQDAISNGTVQVFVHADNTRSLAFGSDDIATQTSIKCKGDIPAACRGGRAHKLGNVQSCDMLSCPCDPDTSQLEFAEMKRMMDIAVPRCTDSRGEFKSLLIGLGGAAIPEYLLAHCPQGTGIESVEFDSRVVKAATNFFGLSLASGINEVENNDGGLAVQDRAIQGKSYDVVMVDCFASSGVPDSCRNEALAQNVHKILKPGGKFIQHIWHNQLDSTLERYKGVFGKDNVIAQDAELGVSWLIISTMA